MIEKKRSTKKQRELLNFVDNFIQGHGYGPSYREMMRALGYKSVSTVAKHVDGLVDGGYLRKRDNSARSLEVVTLHFNEEKTPSQEVVEPEKEKWLVDIIQSKLDKLNKSHNQTMLDEVYVLVGALKALGLDGAYVAMRTQLIDYVKLHPEVETK